MNEIDNLRIVLVATRNPLNIGATARAMSNFGVKHLRLVTPYEPAFREARSAVGASEVLASAEVHETVPSAVADCTLVIATTAGRARELKRPLRPLESSATAICRQLQAGPVAILFGSEKRGLSNGDLSHCHWAMRIPSREEHPSMNLGQAVAVCLYELIRDSSIPESCGDLPALATAAQIERISAALFGALQTSGYVHAGAEASQLEKVRHMIQNLSWNADDAEVWLGMLKQILWKMRSAKE